MGYDRELADLRWHWDTAYDIRVTFGGTWMAFRLVPGEPAMLEADSADGLRALIRADYGARGGARLRP